MVSFDFEFDLEFKMHAQLVQISYREPRKNRISTAMRLAAPRRQANKAVDH